MLTFFVPFCLHWKVGKQDGGGPVLFLMGCQLPLYVSRWIVGIPQESLWELGSTLPDLMNSALAKKNKKH